MQIKMFVLRSLNKSVHKRKQLVMNVMCNPFQQTESRFTLWQRTSPSHILTRQGMLMN